MSDWTVGIKNDDDRKRITEALEEMYRLTQEPPEPPADQRTVLPVTHKQEFDLALAIFDLDGTLTQTRSGARFPQNLQDRTPMRHAQDRIAKLHDFGVKVAVATNQGGVAHGYYNDDELRATLREQMYAWFSIYHWNVAICSHHPGGTVLEYARECACRKPSPYMLLHLMDRHGIAPSQTLFVGDMDSDREAAARAGCHFMWAREYFLKREWR